MPKAKEAISELGIDLAELGSLRNIVDRAKQRINASFQVERDQASKNDDVEIASFPVAILLIAGVNDDSLTKRFALFEAKKMSEFLMNEDDKSLLEIAQLFKWKIEYSQQNYRVHFVNYLNNATSLVHNPNWKLVNRQLDNGQVVIGKIEVIRLLQEEIREYIEKSAKVEAPQLPQIIQNTIIEIKERYRNVKPHISKFNKKAFAEKSEYPPCIQNLYDKMHKKLHLSHTERFTIVTYLLHQGVSVNAIIDLFTSLSDYRQDQTRYQVEHLAGQKGSRTAYTPPNCATLRTHGICVAKNNPICLVIINPLLYHQKKIV